MKRLLLFALTLCGRFAFAVDPVAVWNGDFTTTTKGDYTLAANGNTVAADGSSITISAAKGVSIAKTAGGNVGDQASTVIVKYTNFAPPTGSDAQVLVMNHTANTSYKDFIGAASISGGNIHGIWQNTTWGSNKTATGAYGSALTDTKTFAFAWAQTGTAGAYFWMDGANKNGWSGLHGNLQVDSVWVGGPNESTTLKSATGMKVLAIAVFDSRISDDEIASYTFPEPAKKVEPVMLVNFGYTTAEQGWYNYTQNRGNTIPSSGTLTTNAVSFTATNTIGNFFNSTDGEFDEVTSDWEEGTYEDIFGNSFTTVADELRSSLGVADLPFSANVYKSALMNGGYSEHQVTISGLDGSSKYVVYTGFGMRRTNYPSQVMGVQFDSSGYASVEALDYIATVAGMATTKANRYQSFTAGTQLRPGSEGLLLTRLTNVQPKADGTIAFTFKGDKGGINFLAVAKVNEVKPTSTTINISGATMYANLATDGFADITLNLTGDAELTLDKAVTANLTFTGAHNLTVKNAQHLTFAKVTDAGVTGNLTYEIVGNYTAGNGLVNKIKNADSSRKFVFAGASNTGTTLRISTDNDTYLNKTLATHLVFDGGTHALEIRSESQALNFGSNASAENPTVYVKSGTLNFSARNLCGWGPGVANANGIVRVDDGAVLNLIQVGGTFYWNQQFYLMPGATLNHSEGTGIANNQYNMRMLGGVDQNACQIYVPASATASDKVAKVTTTRGLEAKDESNNKGLGIFVGANSRLLIEGPVLGSPAITKFGAGTLAMSGTVSATNLSIQDGWLAGPGTYSGSLTIGVNAGLAVATDNSVTVTGTLSMPNPVKIAGTLENELVVITVPSAYAVTSPTATDGVKTYELKRSGNKLQLVYKVPPSRAEGSDLTVTPSVEGGVSDSVSIVVPGLNEGDYVGEVTYALHFGSDRVVTGVKEGDQILFAFADELKVGGLVLRGELTASFDTNKTLALGPVTVYQGEQQFVWTSDGELWVNETAKTKDSTGTWTAGIDVAGDKLVVNAANGVTFTPTANPDYVEKCDSTFIVSISASEAVDAASDLAPAADVQGGVRIASVGGVLKLQGLVDGQWADLKSGVATDVDYEVKVSFHYAKSADPADADSVTYEIANAEPLSGAKVAKTTAKISTVEVADGTSLAFLKGICQLDSAVVADVEVVIDHDETKEIAADDLVAAQAIANKMVVAISDEVAKVVDATTYRGYFKVVAKPGDGGKFHAVVTFAPGVQEAIEDDIKKAMEKVVAAFNAGSAAEIAAKPGLYYGVKRGDALNDMAVRDPLTLAGADGKVTITITKPEKSNGHFYRLICTPTPAEEK